MILWLGKSVGFGLINLARVMVVMASGKHSSCFFMTVAVVLSMICPVELVGAHMILDLRYAASAATPPPTSHTNTSAPSQRVLSMASHTLPNVDSKSPSVSRFRVKMMESRSGAFLKPSRCKSAWGSSEMQMTSVIFLLRACSFSVILRGHQHRPVRIDRKG